MWVYILLLYTRRRVGNNNNIICVIRTNVVVVVVWTFFAPTDVIVFTDRQLSSKTLTRLDGQLAYMCVRQTADDAKTLRWTQTSPVECRRKCFPIVPTILLRSTVKNARYSFEIYMTFNCTRNSLQSPTQTNNWTNKKKCDIFIS